MNTQNEIVSSEKVLDMFAHEALRIMYENNDWIKEYERETGKSAFETVKEATA